MVNETFEEQENRYQIERQKIEVAKKLTNDITDYLNTFNDREKSDSFNKAMSNEHRTLQQNFTRLALRWIEHVASDNYQTDPRNESSKHICKQLLEHFNGENGEGDLPSRWLTHI
jgi:hypothetical protein